MERKIDDYLMGKMTEDEFADFEKEMSNSPELAESIEVRRLIIAGLNDAYNVELKNKLRDYDNSLDKSKSWRPILLVAATISLIIISTIIYLQLPKSPRTDSFDFFEAGTPNLMSANGNNQLQNGMNAFKQEDYKEAQIIFEDLLINKPYNDTIQYHIGVTYFRLGDYQMAKKSFEEVIISNSVSYKERSDFRLAMSLIELRDYDQAEKLLHDIEHNSDHEFRIMSEDALKAFFDKEEK